MTTWLPILLGAIMASTAYFSAMKPGERWSSLKRGFVKKPVGSIVSLLILFAFFYAFTSGSRQVAGWLHDTAAPSRDQIREARALILAPIVIPPLLWIAWLSWQARGHIKASRRERLHAPKFVDPSRERRIEIGTVEGD